MVKSFLFFILLLMAPFVLSAQSLRRQVAKKETKTVARQRIGHPSKNKLSGTKTVADTVYCITTKKQHGWFMPLDVVSKEQGREFGGYLMFTRRNSLGHWTKFEKFDSYGNRSSIGFRPYILSEDDPQGDKKWLKKVETGCVCEIIADPQGENVVQERVYDKDMNLVYSFSHTPIGNKKYIGSYKDVYGLPAEMRKDSAFTYGTLVVITEDKWGNDSTIEYVDAKGVPKENSNGVGAQFYVYNKEGRIVRQGSANHHGEYVIDNWGNCGTETEYDEKSGKAKSTVFMDNHWKPISLPNLRGEAGDHAGVTKILYKRNKSGLCVEEKYVTIENKPDTNMFGTHRVVCEYDTYGNCISTTRLRLDGNLSANRWGTAKWVSKYDSIGREIDLLYYGKDGQYEKRPGNWFHEQTIYGDKGEKRQFKIAWKEDCLDTIYFKHSTKEWIYIKYNNNIIEIDSLDEQGYVRDEAYYDYSMNPISLKDLGFDTTPYHRFRTMSFSKGKYIKRITEYLDAKGNYTGERAYRVCIRDTTTKQNFYINYDTESRPIEVFLMDNTKGQLSQSDANAFGVICRAGGSGRTCYYTADVLSSQKGEYTSFVGRDEFGEPDYIYNPSNIFYYQQVSKTGKNRFYDVDNNEIVDYDLFLDKCPKAMSIEVTDSSAYRLGLKDNDIILCYGDSYQMEESQKYSDFVGAWTIAQCLEASKEKQILLFRINPETKDYGVISLALPKGSPSQMGFIVHPTFKTQKQLARIRGAIKKYSMQCAENGMACMWNMYVEAMDRNRNIVVAFPDMFRIDRYYPYPQEITDPSVIIAYCVPSLTKGWRIGEETKALEETILLRKGSEENHPVDFYYTKDWQDVEQKQFEEPIIGFRYFNYKITEMQYNQLQRITKKVRKQINK